VSDEGRNLESEMNLRFPMITISLSYDDSNDPIHVDLGSVPPFVAIAVFERILECLHNVATGPKITFNGSTIVEPITAEEVSFQHLFDLFNQDEDGQED
jgi:hypothetical protein